MTTILPAANREDTRSRDLTEPRTHARADMAEFWRDRRQRQPISWHEASAAHPGFWVVCAHDPAVRIYRDSKQFTSQRGAMSCSRCSPAETMPRAECWRSPTRRGMTGCVG